MLHEGKDLDFVFVFVFFPQIDQTPNIGPYT